MALNIQPVEADPGCVTITVQYKDGCPRSNADVRKIWPLPMQALGTTNESGIVISCGVLGPGDNLVDAWYAGSQFGPNTGLTVDENGDGSATISEDYEIAPPVIEIQSPQNTTYVTTPVPLIFIIYDYSPISWIGYSLDDQPNVTITGNTTLTGLANGPHNIIVYANDTYGNMGSSNKTYFTMEQTKPVGGIWIPVDKLGLLAPYIGLTTIIILATVATAIYVKRKKD